MLNPKLTTVGKLKLAYELSQRDVDDLMAELLPDNVFPLVIWETAYNEHWLWSLKSNALIYDFDIPLLPDTNPLPEKHFTYSLHSNLIEKFFGELIRKAKIDVVKKGLDYIIEYAYENGYFPFDKEMKALFTSLHEEEWVAENRQRKSGPLVINFTASTYYDFISDILFDSIAVDKCLSLKFFFRCGYDIKHEVKGITHRFVDSVIKDAAQEVSSVSEAASAQEEPAIEIESPEQGSVIRVPTHLFDGKSDTAVRDAMKAEYHDSVIAYVMLKWCKFDKTRIGRLLTETKYSDHKSYRNLVDRLMEKASAFTIIKT